MVSSLVGFLYVCYHLFDQGDFFLLSFGTYSALYMAVNNELYTEMQWQCFTPLARETTEKQFTAVYHCNIKHNKI